MRQVVEVGVDDIPGEGFPGDVRPRTGIGRPEVPTPRAVPPMSGPLPATPAAEVSDRPGAGHGAGGFEVNPAVITGAAGVFDAEAGALVDGGTTAAARLATLGVCWGDDRVGARFGATYQPAAERTLHNVAALGAGLSRIAAALRAVGTSYQSVDEGIAAAVDAYARRLEVGTAAGTASGTGHRRP